MRGAAPHARVPAVRPSDRQTVRQLRSRARYRFAIRRRSARRDFSGFQRIRRRPAARCTGDDRGAVRLGAAHERIRAARVRGAELRVAAARGRRLSHRCLAEHGAARQCAVAGVDAIRRQRWSPLIPYPPPESLCRTRRAFSRGLLLGLLLHDARPGAEWTHRSRQEHAGQLRASHQGARAHSQRQSHLLPDTQPAALFRRDGGAVRGGDGHLAGSGVSRRARKRVRVLDGWRRSAQARRVLPAGCAHAGWRRAEPLLGRLERATARVVPAGRRDRANAAGVTAREFLSRGTRHGGKRVGFLEPLDA